MITDKYKSEDPNEDIYDIYNEVLGYNESDEEDLNSLF